MYNINIINIIFIVLQYACACYMMYIVTFVDTYEDTQSLRVLELCFRGFLSNETPLTTPMVAVVKKR